jgi:hypothetical protein
MGPLVLIPGSPRSISMVDVCVQGDGVWLSIPPQVEWRSMVGSGIPQLPVSRWLRRVARMLSKVADWGLPPAMTHGTAQGTAAAERPIEANASPRSQLWKFDTEVRFFRYGER